MKKIRSGVPGMDILLDGGLPDKRTILVSGQCGTGKTVFASQFIKQGFLEGEKGVFVTLEQSKEKLLEDTKELGINFESMIDDKKLVVMGGKIGDIHYFKHKTGASADDIVKEIEAVVKETGATRVALDSVNLFTMLFEGDTEKRQALVNLIHCLDQLDCTTLLTCEVPEGSENLSWHGFEDFVVDGVIKLSRQLYQNQYQRAIAVVKMRGGCHSDMKRIFQIKNRGIIVYPDQEPNIS